MKIVVVTAHADDYIYSTSGTLLTHADDERHVIIMASTQPTATQEVAERLGIQAHVLDGRYRQLAASRTELTSELASLLETIMPDYVLAPVGSGDWGPDHTLTGQIAVEASMLAGLLSSWNARLLRYPIPATTEEFRPNIWVDLPRELVAVKRELAAIMTRGAEGIWPSEIVDWEISTSHRFAQQVGWPSAHVEAFDALHVVPFNRLPPRNDSRASMHAVHIATSRRIMTGEDLPPLPG